MTNDDVRDRIAKMMLGAEWKGGDSTKAIAAETGWTIKHVQTLAREAGGILRHLSGDLPALVSEEQAKLDMVFSMAIEDRELHAAIKAIELKAKLAGALNQPVNPKPPDPVKPGDDARAVREKLLAAVAELDKQIAGEGMH